VVLLVEQDVHLAINTQQFTISTSRSMCFWYKDSKEYVNTNIAKKDYNKIYENLGRVQYFMNIFPRSEVNCLYFYRMFAGIAC